MLEKIANLERLNDNLTAKNYRLESENSRLILENYDLKEALRLLESSFESKKPHKLSEFQKLKGMFE